MRDNDFRSPGVLIVADDARQADRLAGAARALDTRILDRVTLRQAAAAIARRASVDALLIAVPSTPDWPALRTLIGTAPSLVELEPAMLDEAFGWLSPCDAVWLVGTPQRDRIEALSDLLADRIEALSDLLADRSEASDLLAQERPSVRLAEEAGDYRRLSSEAIRIAALLERLATQADVASIDGVGDGPSAPAIRAALRARRLRDRFFDPGLFGDPAWDILLDLMAARIEGQDVSISSLCIAAAVPPTTALRWIRMMLSGGLLERREDPADGRRAFIALADQAADRLTAYLAELGRQGLSIG